MLRSIADVIEQTIQGLPPTIREVVRATVRIQVRSKPNRGDLELGAQPTDRGLFVGFPIREEGDELGGGGELAEVAALDGSGDQLGAQEGAAVLYAGEGGLLAEVEPYQPGGVIVLFTGNIRPLTAPAVIAVLLHELNHFFGDDEDGAFEMGVGDQPA